MDRSTGDTSAGPADRNVRSAILPWVCTAVAIYHLCVVAQLPTWLGVFVPDQMHQAISLCSAFILLFAFLHPRRRWADLLLLAAGLTGGGFVIFFFHRVLDYGLYGYLDAAGMTLATMLVVALLEAGRRVAGWALPVIVVLFVLLTVFQPYLPGILYGSGFSLDRVLFGMYVGDAGIFGLPLNIAANIVIVFLIFGALMDQAGASRWFMNLALALAGWSHGGPAKAAVVASAMLGSISGSPSGNSATTGVFTIPMMKSVGYRAPFAAAVEAVASTGGMILPPVMGAIAFLMAAWIEVPYTRVVMAAAVPAGLYFLIVFISVHLQAHRDGLAPLTREELPSLLPAFVDGWRHLIPFAALIYLLVIAELPPGIAGTYACGSVLVSSYLSTDRDSWLTWPRIIKAFEQGVSRWVLIAVITATVGMMIGSLELSGVGIKFSRFVVDLAGGNLLLTMLCVGAVSLFVGMGLDATPAYITLATLMAPALIRLGVPDIAAHLFVIYWGLASFYTPPTCIAVFVTAGIANSRIWETGWEAMRLGVAAFVIPFAFILNPGLLLEGKLSNIVFSTCAALIAASFFAAGIRGYALGRLTTLQRVLLLSAACLLVSGRADLSLAGLLLASPSLIPRRLYASLVARRAQSRSNRD